MGPLLVVLLLVLIFFGVGFAIHLLWWVAVVALVVWLLGFLVRGTHSSGSRNRWYRW
ncbi:hydrophobic protein [Streptomyces sp. NBC_00448]|uniref:hydrophobic protein n=1 Tax=Streptomyces sp. NBC_00448 TaxID=2903652 RepID=UPI002E1C0A75